VKLAIYGQAGIIGKEIEKYILHDNFEVNILSRNHGSGIFSLQRFSENSFKDYDSVLFLAHDYGLKPTSFNKILIEVESCLQRHETEFLYFSTLSAYSGNRSRYSKQKLALEALFLDYGHVVLRSGIILPSESSAKLRAQKQLLAFFKFIPFRLIDKERTTEYFLTDLSDVSKIISSVIARRSKKIESVYSVGPISIDDLLTLLGGKASFWKIPLRVSTLKNCLQSLGPLFSNVRIFDKVLNLSSGMSNSSTQ